MCNRYDIHVCACKLQRKSVVLKIINICKIKISYRIYILEMPSEIHEWDYFIIMDYDARFDNKKLLAILSTCYFQFKILDAFRRKCVK